MTDSIHLALELEAPEDGLRLDLIVNGVCSQRYQLHEKQATALIAFNPLPAGEKSVEIWCDPQYACRLIALYADDEAFMMPTRQSKKRWVHYGSSISHSPLRSTPSSIWSATVAQRCGLHLTNLGFRGNCHAEPILAQTIRDLPADYITLKIGINIYENGSLSARTFTPNIIGFIRTIREKHPQTPIVLITPIYSAAREQVMGRGGMTLQEIRAALQDAAERLHHYGDTNLYVADGLKLLGEADQSCMPDGLHPDDAGEAIMADRFIKEIFNGSLHLEEPVQKSNISI